MQILLMVEKYFNSKDKFYFILLKICNSVYFDFSSKVESYSIRRKSAFRNFTFKIAFLVVSLFFLIEQHSFFAQTTYNYTGAQQTFVAPTTGCYQIQVWGAKGGNDAANLGGNGGYATGKLILTAGQTIYIYVGAAGTSGATGSGGGWNGGGNAGNSGSSGGGGGASDVRFGGTALSNRVIVAGGGGGAGNTSPQAGGAGGGLTGISSSGSGGTQSAGGAGTSAGSLGQGGNRGSGDGGGGGGGYYGGGAGNGDHGGGGGSSYIGGVSDASTIAGNASMPNPAGGTFIGNPGNGVVRITLSSAISVTSCPSNVTVNAASGQCFATATWTNPSWTGCPPATISGANYMGTHAGNYYYHVPATMTWTAAKADAEAKGGRLAMISNSAENSFIAAYLTANSNVSAWIGYSDQVTEGNFVSVTGVPLSFGNSPSVQANNVYNNWNGGEPNNCCADGEDFTEIQASGGWNDLGPTATRGYVMEFGVIQTAGLENGASNFPVGTTTVSYNVYLPNAVSTTCSFTVTVNSTTPSSVAISSAPLTNICHGTNVTFTAVPTGGGTTPVYQWKKNGSNVGIGLNTFSADNLIHGDVITCQMTSNATACMSPVTSNSITMSFPSTGTSLNSTTKSATCRVNGNSFVRFYNGGELLGAVNAKNVFNADVTLTSYVLGSAAYMDACNNPGNVLYRTAYMGRNWVVTISNVTDPIVSPEVVDVLLPFYTAEFTALSIAAGTVAAPTGGTLSPGNSNDNITNVTTLKATKYSNPGSENGSPTDNCSGGTSVVLSNAGTGSLSSGTYNYGITNGQYAMFQVGGFSEFYLHGSSSNSPLPVELISFQGSCFELGTNLIWQTATESNNDYFMVQRSRDGLNWEDLSLVNGSGNSNQLISYQYVDYSGFGDLYYRLTQVDFNGDRHEQQPIFVHCNVGKTSMQVYPNPTSSDFTVEINTDLNYQSASISIIDLTGKTLIQRPIHVLPGSNQFHFDDQVAVGSYLIQIQLDDTFQTLRFLVK